MDLREYLKIALLFHGLVAGTPFAQSAGAAASWILNAPDVQHVDLAIIKRRIHLTKSADAYVAPLNKWFLRALDENRLRAQACRVSTDDPARVADLVKILDESDLQSASFSPSGFEPRELIYLRLSNGEAMKILLAQRAGTPQSITGTIDYKQISVSAKTVDDLYQWVADLSASNACPSHTPVPVGAIQRRDD